ncbi:MAG: CBS domain-containing protein [Symploca sp. SIO3C6]|nr:CBS domain-containing protein [Symploca sp. SIO3C6]
MQTNGLLFESLALEAAIDPNFLAVAPTTPLKDVLVLMSQFRSCLLPNKNLNPGSKEADLSAQRTVCCSQEWETLGAVADTAAGCVLVIDKLQLAGIFTERDIVKLTAAGLPLASFTIGDCMGQPPITLTKSQANDIFTALELFRQHQIRHLPIVNQQGQPLGIVTHESIRRALQPVNLLTRLRQVQEIMTTEVVCTVARASALQIAKLMSQHQVSCVVITQQQGLETEEWGIETQTIEAESCLKLRERANDNVDDEHSGSIAFSSSPSAVNIQDLIPVGIVTERDILQFQAMELDLSRMLAKDVMSTPLFCLEPTDSLWNAHEKMQQYHVRRLIVTGTRGELVGLVSQTSLLKVLNPSQMYGVIEILQQLLAERTSQLETTNEQLRHEIIERRRAETALLQAHTQLKEQVEQRTADLTKANEQLKQDIQKRQQVEAALRESEAKSRTQATKLELALQTLHSYQTQLIQKEKMSSLGKLVAGVAHEINNPINFVYGNIAYANQYIQDIMELLKLYEQQYPQQVPKILAKAQTIDLDFVKNDLPKLLKSMRLGAERIRDLVLSLRNFSRLDEAEMKSVNLHEGIDNTLLILQNRLKGTPGRSEIKLIKEYSHLPKVECYSGQLNQVFMNLLSNAIDALEEYRLPNSQVSAAPPTITITTELKELSNDKNNAKPSSLIPHAIITITDNGSGMTEAVRRHLFDPFFTTKSVGKGTGLGLSISYQVVVEKHNGRIEFTSALRQGTKFDIAIPIRQSPH